MKVTEIGNLTTAPKYGEICDVNGKGSYFYCSEGTILLEQFA